MKITRKLVALLLLNKNRVETSLGSGCYSQALSVITRILGLTRSTGNFGLSGPLEILTYSILRLLRLFQFSNDCASFISINKVNISKIFLHYMLLFTKASIFF